MPQGKVEIQVEITGKLIFRRFIRKEHEQIRKALGLSWWHSYRCLQIREFIEGLYKRIRWWWFEIRRAGRRKIKY